MTMFTKRVKCIRDMNAEVEVLERKLDREISKLNDNVILEIKKTLRRISPHIQVKVRKVRLDDFLDNRKRQVPLMIVVEAVNGKKVHKDGFWVEKDEKTGRWLDSDNRISVERLQEVCYKLSEDLAVNIQIEKVS